MCIFFLDFVMLCCSQRQHQHIFVCTRKKKPKKNKELLPRNDLVSVDDAFRLYFYDSWTKFESSGQCHSNEEVAACTLARHSHSDQNC